MSQLHHASCPTAIVKAPTEVVWQLLTEPSRWGEFFDVRRVTVTPPGTASVGQVVRAESGPRLLRLKDQCRVNYGCNFEFPHGWRGVLARLFLHKEIDAGPADSLLRLKRRAEQLHANARA